MKQRVPAAANASSQPSEHTVSIIGDLPDSVEKQHRTRNDIESGRKVLNKTVVSFNSENKNGRQLDSIKIQGDAESDIDIAKRKKFSFIENDPSKTAFPGQ